jgi:hypothetical protein
MSQSNIQVRIAKKLANIIQLAKPKAKVFHYWIVGQGGIGESVPDLLSTTETEWGADTPPEGWIHGYVIGYDGFPREKVANASFKDSSRFRLWGFYDFYKGNATKNSADIASVHWKDIQNAISAATKLQQVIDIPADPDGVPEVIRHYEWDITQAGIYHMGSHKCHIAQGELIVESRLTINMVPIT